MLIDRSTTRHTYTHTQQILQNVFVIVNLRTKFSVRFYLHCFNYVLVKIIDARGSRYEMQSRVSKFHRRLFTICRRNNKNRFRWKSGNEASCRTRDEYRGIKKFWKLRARYVASFSPIYREVKSTESVLDKRERGSNRIEMSIELQMLASARARISFVNTCVVTPKNIRTITEFDCVGLGLYVFPVAVQTSFFSGWG